MNEDTEPNLTSEGGIPFDQSHRSVTRPRAIALVAGAFIFTTLTALLCTGFQGLHPILVEEQVYHNLCTGVDDATNATTPVCIAQALRYNLMLTISVAALNIACFPAGFCVDKFGPRVVGIAGSVLLTAGSVLFAFSNSETFDAFTLGSFSRTCADIELSVLESDPLVFKAYSLLGVGGVCIFMSVLHLLNLFPEKRGFLVTLFTAAEDASTGIFFFFHQIYKLGVSMKALFLGYTIVPITFLSVVAIQPKKPILAEKMENRGEYYPISRAPLRTQATSLAYILIIIWNCICCVTTYFYLGNMHEQLLWLFESEQLAKEGTQLFSLFFMIFPFATVPLTGWVMNSLGTWPSLLFVAVQMACYGIFSLIPSWPLQYVTWFMFVVCRSSFIGVSAHYVNVMFGDNFSSLMGLVWTIGGFSTLTNYFWSWIFLVPLKGNFAVMMNIMTAIAVSSTLFLAFMVYRWSKEASGSSSYKQVLDDVQEELAYLKDEEYSDEESSDAEMH